jgi:aryl-alcohol dehydrogenase-like predicted oxidoreductase
MVQAALRFVLDHPGVSSVIAGAKTRQQIEENVGASALPALTPKERTKGHGHRRHDWHAELESMSGDCSILTEGREHRLRRQHRPVFVETRG